MTCNGKNGWRRSKYLLMLVVFVAIMLDVMLMTSIDPILPSILSKIKQEKDASFIIKTENKHLADCEKKQHENGEIGIMIASKPIIELFTNIIVGMVVQKVGHKWPMYIGIIFNFGATLGWAYGNSFWLLLLTRGLQALGSSLSVVSGIALLNASFTNDVERQKASSWTFCGVAVGILIGYPFGCFFYEFFGRQITFLVLAGISLFDGLMRLLLIVPDGRVVDENSGGLCKLVLDPYILNAFFISFIQHIALGLFLATGPKWMLCTLNAELWQIGVVLGGCVFVYLIFQLLTGYLAAYIKRWVFCALGLCVAGVGFICYPYCHSIWQTFGPEATVRAGHGMILGVMSPLMAFISDTRHSGNYGLIGGLYTASYVSGLGVGSLLGGFLMDLKSVTFFRMYQVTGIVLIVWSFFGLIFKRIENFDPVLKTALLSRSYKRARSTSVGSYGTV